MALLASVLLASSLALPPFHAPTVAAQTVVDWGDIDTTGLVDLGPAEPGVQLTFLFGLTTDRAGRNAAALAARSPRDPSYGEHLPLSSVVEHFGASDSAAAAVTGALTAAGIEGTLDPTRTFVEASMSVAEAEALLSTTWHIFEVPESSFWFEVALLMPTTTPTLPPAMVGNVERVHGAVVELVDESESETDTDAVGNSTDAVGNSTDAVGSADIVDGGTPTATGTPTGCAEGSNITDGGLEFGLTPSQVLAAYGIDDLHAMGLRGQGRNVAIVDDSTFDPAWLATFRDCFGLQGATEVSSHVVGEPGTSEAGETILDASVMSAVAPELARLDVFMVAGDTTGPTRDQSLDITRMFAAPLNAALTGGATPDVISASFGACEVAPTLWGGRTALVGITEDLLATAAAAGISWVVSTGDSGASGCEAYYRLPDYPVPQKSVQYPGSSAWVTAVGGTNLTLDASNGIASSGVWNDTQFPSPFDSYLFAGTGGVSEFVPRPPWQDPVADTAGPARAVPDISLFADAFPGYAIFGPDGWEAVGGTSAATPLFAGVLALLGQQAAAMGQPGPGFANPLIYELASSGSTSLLDITLGNNDVLGIGCCAAGPGFDLASGWGSPIASKLASELAAPTVSLGASRRSTGDAVTLAATTELPAGSVLSYEWDVDGDGTVDARTTEPSIATTAVAGATATVAVTTSLGRVASGSTTVPGQAVRTDEGAPLSIAG